MIKRFWALIVGALILCASPALSSTQRLPADETRTAPPPVNGTMGPQTKSRNPFSDIPTYYDDAFDAKIDDLALSLSDLFAEANAKGGLAWVAVKIMMEKKS